MASMPDGTAANSPLKRGSSFNNSSMESSPTSGFPSTEFEGHHLQPSQGPWHQRPAAQLETHFSFVEDQGDTRRLLPTFFSTGTDGYGNVQFGSPLAGGSSTWDNKLSYMSSAANGVAANPLSITGNPSSIAGHGQMHAGLPHVNAGQGHVNEGHAHVSAGLDYLEHMQAHINGDVSLRKMMMLPQSSSELFKQSSWAPLNVGASLDPSNEGLPAQGMNLAASHCLPNLSADPGFADRAARFSPFGNMGYSECMLAGDGNKDLNKAKLNQIKPVGQYAVANRSAPNSPNGFNVDNGNLNGQENIRFPSKETSLAVPLEGANRGIETKTSFSPTLNMLVDGDEGAQKQFCASVNESDESTGQEVSSCCEKSIGGGAAAMQVLAENVGRKRKAGSQKLKDGGGLAANPKDIDPDNGRSKCHLGSDNAFEKISKPLLEQSNSGNSGESTPKSVKENSKPPEAPKPDFIHVRARRGQATDSHSLAERVRREKISERMKFLQDLVPGCSKVTGKAVMLDEIINYVQSLQRQVEFLSMKLAAVNPRVEFNIENLFGRERPVQPRVATPASVFGLENANLYPPLHPHQQPQIPLQALGQCPQFDVQSFGPDPALRQTMSTPPPIDTYGDAVSQVSQGWDDELQSVVSFSQRPAPLDLQGQFFHGQMKVEH
eukprot:c21477_g1_i1 orf=490-2478(+)